MDRIEPNGLVGTGRFVALVDLGLSRLTEWKRRRQIRGAFGSVSSRLLRDIGLTEAELQDALAQPLGRPVSDKLQELAAARAGTW